MAPTRSPCGMVQIGFISIACRARRALLVRKEQQEFKVCKDPRVIRAQRVQRALRAPPVQKVTLGRQALLDHEARRDQGDYPGPSRRERW